MTSTAPAPDREHPTLAALIADRAVHDPDRKILTFVSVDPDGALRDESRTYRALHDHGMALARGLRALGLRRGERFAVMMPNLPEFVDAMIAAGIIGAVFVPIDPRTTGEKLAHMLRSTGCRGVICASGCVGALLKAGADLAWLIAVGDVAGASGHVHPYASVIASDAALAPDDAPAPSDPMFMMFTSGTTGLPKAVVQKHGAYMRAATAMRALGIGPGDVLYTGLSLTHINAQGTLRAGLALSLPVVVSEKFTKSRLWDICRRYGCTVFNLLGGMIPEIFSVPPRPDDADNPVRLIISAGMPKHLWHRYQERFGVQICEVYGATEGGGALVNPPGIGPVGSMGKPGAGIEAAVFDESGRPCGPGEPGELCFRPRTGAAARVHYHDNEAASREKTRDGWFRTGDIVHCDEDGWFFFHHRIGGGVRRNGDFVNTALVEAVISSSRLVSDVFVYGVPTARNVAGEKTLVAAVVPADPDRFQEDLLLAHCRDALERNDVPETFQVLAAIPKTMSEKPIERACIELLEAARGAAWRTDPSIGLADRSRSSLLERIHE